MAIYEQDPDCNDVGMMIIEGLDLYSDNQVDEIERIASKAQAIVDALGWAFDWAWIHGSRPIANVRDVDYETVSFIS